MGVAPRSPPHGLVRRLVYAAAITAALTISACNRESRSKSANIGWPSYNNSYDGQRYAAPSQIDTRNVSRLKPACEFKLGEEGPFQTGPLVIGETMFLTTAHTTVAMSATTCSLRWRHVDSTGQQDPISVNRGAAYLDGRLFRGLPGARLAALDAATGKVLWTVKVGDLSVAEFLSSAPIAWRGMVSIGLAGGDWGIRGRVMGYDAASGKEVW